MKPEEIRSAQIVDVFYPVIDGVVHTVHNYASIMNKISYSCVVCPAAKGGYDDSTLGFDVIRCASLRIPTSDYTVAWPVNPSSAKKIAAIPGLDIIHIHSPFTQRDSAVKAANKLGIPLVATFHTKYYDDIYQVTKSKTLAKIVTDSVVNFYNICDSVWACSESTAETLKSYGYKGKVEVMPNGTSMEKPENPEELKKISAEKYGIDTTKNNLLFVGTPSWQKNLRLILDTFRVLSERDQDVYRLTIAGDGDDVKNVKAYAKKIGISDRQINFTGQIEDQNELAGVFLASDLFFFPSVYDNAPLVLREAAALSVPALLTEGSNSAEVVMPDVNGFVAKENKNAMADKIESLFADREKLKKAGEEASKTIPVPWENIIPKVMEKYAEIINERNSKRIG